MSYIEEEVLTVDGSVTKKRYQLLMEIGSGSFSKCWKVRPVGTDKIFAMKMISKKSLKSLQQEKVRRQATQLVNQIQIHQALSHPNIVFLEHSFEDAENQYLFLEYCPNGTLQEKCKKFISTPEDDIRRYGMQILQAIKYLHSRKILHRDLKLSNCFLGQEDHIKIGDFGFACKLQSNEELKRQTCGTPNFLSPEVAGGFGHSYPSDVWSFGIILYRMKYGVCPFETASLQQTIQRIKTVDYSFSKWVNITPELKDLIGNILTVDYDARLTIDEIEKHPFFLSETEGTGLKRSGSLSGFIRRLFSKDKSKGQEPTIKKVDSCKNLIDMKEILKEKTKDNTKSMKDIGMASTATTATTEGKKATNNYEDISRVYFNKITEAKTLRLPPKGKPKAPSVTQFYPYCLVYCVDIENDYAVCYLTNGLRQIIRQSQNVILLDETHYCDRTGKQLASLPRPISYIVKERLKEGSCKLSQKVFEQHIQKRNFILKYKQISPEHRLFVLHNSSIMTTGVGGVFYLHSEYSEFLYNSRLETLTNQELLKKCQEMMTKEAVPVSPIPSARHKKFLE